MMKSRLVISWGWHGGGRDELQRETENFRDNRYIHYLDCDDGFMVVYSIHMSKLKKLYLLEICSLMCIN